MWSSGGCRMLLYSRRLSRLTAALLRQAEAQLYRNRNRRFTFSYSQVAADDSKRSRTNFHLFNCNFTESYFGKACILSYNGGAVIAMRGKECVAIASDLRYGVELRTITTDFPKVFEVTPYLWVGLPGLATDTQTVTEKIKFRTNMYELKEGRKMKPKTFAAMLSNMLYERRFGPFFVEPVVAGLDPVTKESYICNMDLIGCTTKPEDFVVAGTAEEQLFGMCEALWSPDMTPDELFEGISQALTNACDRDASAGWGGIVHIIEPHQITTRTLKTRMD